MKKYLLLIFVFIISSCNDELDPKPNILWIVTEDNSLHYMNLYTKGGAEMPNVSSLASEGIVFNNAFSNAPVCSVARSTIITGVYSPRIGTQYHRRMSLVKLPDDVKPLPVYLKEAGYYTSNNSKEDYNFIKDGEIWDESSGKASYKNRKKEQPFFHVQNFHNTHEGQLHFDQEHLENALKTNNLDSVKPFPYHPDTPTFRYTQSLYHNHHKDVDKEIGKFIKKLEDENLLDNTIIFYYADHGGVLPRSKGYIYESGLNVPLVVRVPEKFKKLSPFKSGSRTSTFIEFVDLVPTVLSLAGIEIPRSIDGKPFLGKKLNTSKLEKQNTTFGYADRFDEKYDLVRSVRMGKYKYIRNYQPFNVDGLYNFYRYKMLAYKEWYSLFHQGKLNEVQSQFFKPRAPEALYNIDEDPHETKNLAKDKNHIEILLDLRTKLNDHLISINDLSFIPEPHLLENGLDDIVSYSEKNKDLISRLIKISDLQLNDYEQVSSKIQDALKDINPWVRYWGLIVSSSFGSKALENKEQISFIFENDPENLVRMRAAEFMLLNNLEISDSKINSLLKKSNIEAETNLMLNTLANIKTSNPNFKLNLNKKVFPENWLPPIREENALVNRRMNYLTNSE